MLYQCSHPTLAPDRRANHQGASDARANPPLLHAAPVARAQRALARPLIAVAQPDQRRHFDTLEDCFAYLREQAAAPNRPSIHLDGSSTIVAQMEAPEK